MKRRICVVVISCLIFTTLCGCTRYQKIKKYIYDTDVFGEYTASSYSNDGHSDEGRLVLLNNGTFSYTRKTISESMGTDEYKCSGSFTNENINSEVTKLSFAVSDESGNSFCSYSLYNYINKKGTYLYKYKNMLGRYISVDICDVKNRSDFSIPLDNNEVDYYRFSKDGTCKSDGTPNEERYHYKYKVKSGIIWIDYNMGFGFQPEYFIVEDGLFYDCLKKSR